MFMMFWRQPGSDIYFRITLDFKEVSK